MSVDMKDEMCEELDERVVSRMQVCLVDEVVVELFLWNDNHFL